MRWCNKAFSKIDFDGSGLVSRDEIDAVYDPSNHPDVLLGNERVREILTNSWHFRHGSSWTGVQTGV